MPISLSLSLSLSLSISLCSVSPLSLLSISFPFSLDLLSSLSLAATSTLRYMPLFIKMRQAQLICISTDSNDCGCNWQQLRVPYIRIEVATFYGWRPWRLCTNTTRKSLFSQQMGSACNSIREIGGDPL
jgi:hypothetical protein